MIPQQGEQTGGAMFVVPQVLEEAVDTGNVQEKCLELKLPVQERKALVGFHHQQ